MATSSWLSRLLIPAAVLGMEAAWLTPLIALALNGLHGGEARMAPAITIALLMFAAFGARLLSYAVTGERLLRGLTVAGAVVSTAVVVWVAHYADRSLLSAGWPLDVVRHAFNLFADAPSLAGSLMACGFLWWRGLGLATEAPSFDAVFGRFRAGMVIMVLFHLIGLILGGTPLVSLVTGSLAPNVLLFFFCGLLALALSRAEDERSEAVPGKEPRFNRQWAVFLLLALAGEGLVALIFAALLAPEAMAFITAPLAFAGGLLLQLLLWVLIAISYVVDAILTGIFWLLSQFGLAPEPTQLETATAPAFPEEEPDPDQEPAIPDFVLAAARGSLVVLVVALALLVLWRALRRPGQKTSTQAAETRESVWSWELAKQEVVAALRAVWRRLRRQGQATVAALAGLAGVVLDGDDLASVRGVYRALLRTAHKAGIGRHPEQTAGEFGAVLAGHVPEAADGVAVVTAAYQWARYGRREAAADLPSVVAAWHQVQEAWRRQTAERSRAVGSPQEPGSEPRSS